MSSEIKVLTEDNENSSLVIKEVDVEDDFRQLGATLKSGAKGVLNIAKEYTALFNYTLKSVAQKDPEIPDDIAESYESYMKNFYNHIEILYSFFEKQKTFSDIIQFKIKKLSKKLEDSKQEKDIDLEKEDETKK